MKATSFVTLSILAATFALAGCMGTKTPEMTPETTPTPEMTVDTSSTSEMTPETTPTPESTMTGMNTGTVEAVVNQVTPTTGS